MDVSLDEFRGGEFGTELNEAGESPAPGGSLSFKRMVYNDSHAADEGFYSGSYDSRLGMLRGQKTRKRLAQEEQKKLTKKATKLQQKTVTALRFSGIASARSEWVEVTAFAIESINKTSVSFKVESLREFTSAQTIPHRFLAAKASKPLSLPMHFQTVVVDDVLDDPDVSRAFRSENHGEDELCVAINVHFLSLLAGVSEREFPFNLTFSKRENKIIFDAYLDKENPFTSLLAHNENAKDLPENEEEVFSASEKATLVQRNLQAFGVSAESSGEESYKAAKLSIDSRITVYTRVKVDAQTEKGEPILVRSLYEHGSTRQGNFSKTESQMLTDAWMKNIALLEGWIIQSVAGGAQRFVIGFVENEGPSKPFKLLKLERKTVDDFKTFLNINEAHCFQNLRTCLTPLAELSNGDYVLHKPEGRGPITIYKTSVRELE